MSGLTITLRTRNHRNQADCPAKIRGVSSPGSPGHHENQLVLTGAIRGQPQRIISCRGFSLTELLVVIAIIAILACILLPSINMVKKLAGRTAAANSMRQIGLAVSAYVAENEGILPGPMRAGCGISFYTIGVVNQFSLGNYLWPYLESAEPSVTHCDLEGLRDRRREAAGFPTFWVRNNRYYPSGTKVGIPIDLNGALDAANQPVSFPHPLGEINSPSSNIFLQDCSLELYTANGPHPATAFYGRYLTLYWDFHVDTLPLCFKKYLY